MVSTTTKASGIIVYVSYLRDPDLKFNTDYYLRVHLPAVEKYWTPYGLKSWTVLQFDEDDESGIHTQCVLEWDSIASFQKAWDAKIPEVMDDFSEYSNQLPVKWFGQVKARQ